MFLFFRTSRAFTLVELMIVIAIIGILAAALFPSMSNYLARSRDAATHANIKKVILHLGTQLQDHGGSFSGVIDEQFYCVPLKDSNPIACHFNPLLPGIPVLGISVQEFNINGQEHANPVFTVSGNDAVTRITNGDGKRYPILVWTLPGVGDYNGPGILEPQGYPIADRRCIPGFVRTINWGNKNLTECQVAIQ